MVDYIWEISMFVSLIAAMKTLCSHCVMRLVLWLQWFARWFGGILLYILGTFHLIFSLWMAVEYFVGNLPNFVLPSWLTRCGFPSMCLLCNWPLDVIVIVL